MNLLELHKNAFNKFFKDLWTKRVIRLRRTVTHMLPHSPHRLLRGVDAIMPGELLFNNSLLLLLLLSLFDDTVSKFFLFANSNISGNLKHFRKAFIVPVKLLYINDLYKKNSAISLSHCNPTFCLIFFRYFSVALDMRQSFWNRSCHT
jgi:hypothetical protein